MAATGAETLKSTVEQFTTAGNQAFKDSVEKSMAALGEANANSKKNLEAVVVAFRDCCPHLANPLSKGRLEAHVLVCSAHEWEFDVRDGRGVNPSTACLSAYPVRLEGDRILVDVGGSVR